MQWLQQNPSIDETDDSGYRTTTLSSDYIVESDASDDEYLDTEDVFLFNDDETSHFEQISLSTDESRCVTPKSVDELNSEYNAIDKFSVTANAQCTKRKANHNKGRAPPIPTLVSHVTNVNDRNTNVVEKMNDILVKMNEFSDNLTPCIVKQPVDLSKHLGENYCKQIETEI